MKLAHVVAERGHARVNADDAHGDHVNVLADMAQIALEIANLVAHGD